MRLGGQLLVVALLLVVTFYAAWLAFPPAIRP
jgi:hypothetical protein